MAWIPIALSRDIPPGTTRAALLEGRELVAWLSASGALHIWEDRCPHRGMRLSFGFVRGEALNCLYHGWQYGTGSSCQRIPAHPDLDVPNTIKAKAFVAAESGGLVLVNLSSAGPAPMLPRGTPVASVAVSAPSDAILALCAAPPHGDAQIFDASLDGIACQIGWHDVAPDKTMLHAAISDGDAQAALAALHELRAAAERRAAA